MKKYVFEEFKMQMEFRFLTLMIFAEVKFYNHFYNFKIINFKNN